MDGDVTRVYRIPLDAMGEAIHDDIEDDYLGDLDGVIEGGPTPHSVSGWEGLVSTDGMMGWPRLQRSEITVRKGDRLVIGGLWYEVAGPAQWHKPHALSGTDLGYVWHRVRTVQ
jgi:hypothetical protein